ncbi:MAG: exodeoxyribonuclease VII large subunit [Phycisphaerae bacterium]|nr:exodeoxyribonuclease VII large subunit [Phycisphaerae bacterium]
MAKRKTQLPVFTVTQLNSLIQVSLANALPGRLILRGEITNWKRHSSGHCYFSLKDNEGGQIPCVMWGSKFREVRFDCENGLAILATGYVDVYVPGGKYQFYAEKLEPAGIGDLQLAFEQMRKRLEAEGLFDAAHKKPIPAYAMRIGVVTSRSGAAIVDICDSITNRWPCAKIYVFDAPVQGEGAAAKIVAAIQKANAMAKHLRLELLIVGRGGGSMEDLWAFNEEPVARAIYASRLPIISAVGHEVDVTIADLVADARASTPTKAGVIAVPDYREELGKLHSFKRRLYQNTRSQVQHGKNRLATVLASRVFRLPLGPVQVAAQRVDELAASLFYAAKSKMTRFREHLERIRRQVQKIEPSGVISQQHIRLHHFQSRNQAAVVKVLSKNQLKLAALENKLTVLDPRSVLNRGYSLTMSERTGGVVTDVDQVQVNDRLTTELAKGQKIHSRVEETEGPKH